MQSKAATVTEYLAELPEDRRKAIRALRAVINKNLGKGYKEGMQYGMIGYAVPHSIYPAGYHCDPRQPLPFASIASQKNHIGLYLFCIYCDPAETARFQKAWLATGKKLDMGKGCVRFKRIEDVPLEVVGEAIKRIPVEVFIKQYESVLPASKRRTPKTAKKTAKKVAGKSTAKKPTKKTAKQTVKKAARSRARRD